MSVKSDQNAIDNGCIEWRYTPWDKVSLECETIELQSIRSKDPYEIEQELQLIIEETKAELIYGRFSASDRLLKKTLLNAGFYIAETSAKVFLNGLQRLKLDGVLYSRDIEISYGDLSDKEDVERIVNGMFDFSRFHEDIFIEECRSNRRMVAWIGDLINQNKPFMISRDRSGNLISFMFYEVAHNSATLILGGADRKARIHSPFFWGAVMKELQLIGVERVETQVSIANTGVLSLYQELGFRITSTFNDFHWNKFR